MAELKTLEDLSKPENIGYISTSRLRQEAIKWIKEISFREKYQEHEKRSSKNDLIHTIDWLKVFYGITEEELK